MIEITELHKEFKDKKVLQGINLEINEGETLTIIGNSGCGKSVLLKHIVGLLTPDKGSVKVGGTLINTSDHQSLYKIREQFGFLFQGAALFDSMTVGENIGLPLVENNKKYTDSEISKSIAEKLELVGLPGIENLKPSELSGGMKKRVGLARSLVTNPKYMLYDEPTTGLDPIMSDSIDLLIKDLTEKINVTSIVVTHDMLSVRNVADMVALVYNGRIEFHGTPDELTQTTNPIVSEFISRTGF